MAEAMGLDENAEVLHDMVEQNAQAWVQIQEMLEEHTLHYRAKGKKNEVNNMETNNIVTINSAELIHLTTYAYMKHISKSLQNFTKELEKRLNLIM